jgi:O-antigen/teichoic acid export membrane protein
VLIILSIAIFFETFKFVTDPFLNGTEHARIVSRIEIFKLVLTVGIGFFLIRMYGAMGAAVSFLTGSVISCALKLFMVKRALELDLYKEAAKVFVIAAFLIYFPVFIVATAAFVAFSRLISLKEIKTIYSLIVT